VYAALEELEIIAIRKNLKTKVIQKTLDSSSITFTSRHKKRTIHCSIYSPAFWQIYEVYTQEITYIKNMFGWWPKGQQQFNCGGFLTQIFSVHAERHVFLHGCLKESGGCCRSRKFFSIEMPGNISHRLPATTSSILSSRFIMKAKRDYPVLGPGSFWHPRKRSYKFNPSRQRWIYSSACTKISWVEESRLSSRDENAFRLQGCNILWAVLHDRRI